MKNLEFNTDNLVYVVQKHAKDLASNTAFTLLDDDKNTDASISYAELDLKARTIASWLQHQNFHSQRILLVYSTGIEFISAFVGCLYAGAIAVPVNAPKQDDFAKSADLIKAIAEDADISAILTDSQYVEDVQSHFHHLNLKREIKIQDSTSLKQKEAKKYALTDIHDEGIAYLQYTSGSTSAPKGVMTSHKNLKYTLLHSARHWDYAKDSITLTWAPHSHVYGLVCGLLLPLYTGTPGFMLAPVSFIRRPAIWLEAISKYHVTHSGCPNFAYDLCVQDVDVATLKRVNLKRWKVAVNGGEGVQYQTLIQFMKKFEPLKFQANHMNSAYGMSEASGLIASTTVMSEPDYIDLTLEDLKHNKAVLAKEGSTYRKFVSSGHLMQGMRAEIVDPETLLPVKNEGIGEIWLAGEGVASGYWRRPEESRQVFGFKLPTSEERFFRTGDLGFIREGELCVTGRLKELIVIRGKKYYPLDIENAAAQALSAQPVNLNRAAFGVMVNDHEEVIFLQELKGTLLPELQDQIINLIRRAVVARFGIDLYAVILVKANTLPKTASGKLQHKKCEQTFEQNNLEIIKADYRKNAAEAILPEATARAEVKGEVAQFQTDFLKLVSSVLKIDIDKINVRDAVSRYQFDSINLIQLTDKLNETFHLSLTPAILFEFTTLEEFVDGLLSKDRDAIHRYYQSNYVDKTAMPHTAEQGKAKNHEEQYSSDIAIIGMSGIFPAAANVETYWDNLVTGVDAIREVPKDRWNWKALDGDPQQDINKTNIKWGGFVDDIAQFDAGFFSISPREAEMTDPQQRLFLQTALAAIEDAGYSTETLAKGKTGLYVGAFSNDYAELLHQNGVTDAYTTTGLIHSILANRVSYLLNLHGPSVAIDTACSSSLVALHHAVQAIQSGDCDVTIVGGVNALVTPTSFLSASKAGMLSTEGRCRTFDKNANGYVRSEGVAAVVLKSLAQAKKDGDHIYGVIKGTAVNHGGNVSSLTVPNPIAQAEVIVTACQRAGISPDTISFIETHGTGTSLGDPIEINGLKKAFSELSVAMKSSTSRQHYCGLGAVKSNVGHLESAAGMAGLIKVLLAMKHETIPGNLHFGELNPYIELDDSPFYIANKTQKWDRFKDHKDQDIPYRAGVSSFGFGGTNAHVIIEEYRDASHPVNNEDGSPYLFALSAKTETALKARISELNAWLDKQTVKPSLSALSFTLNTGRNHFNMRSVFIADSIEKLQAALQLAEAGQSPEVSTTDDHLTEVAARYRQGADIDWSSLHYTVRQRLSLPTYPFAKDHYWIDLSNAKDVYHSRFKEQANTSSVAPKHLSLSGNAFDFVQEDFVQHVTEILKLKPSQISATASLTDLGFDSISLKELALKLEQHYSIKLAPSVFFTHKSIAAITAFLIEEFPTEVMRIYAPVEAAWVQSDEPMILAGKTLLNTSLSEPIAVIGMQGMFPQSRDTAEFWDHLEAGHDLVSEIPLTRWDWHNNFGDAKQNATKTNSKWGGLIPDVDQFDASFFKISAREANLMDPQQRLFMEVVWRAIEDAGYDPESLSDTNVGLFAGVEFSEYETLIHKQDAIFHGHVATGTSHAMLANRISYFLNLHGPSEVIDTACSSSLVAVNRAVSALQRGECSIAIAGGVSLMLDPDTFVITSQLGALSPDGRCKTFDKSANGYVKGEGVVALMLKPLSQAEKDGDHIYGLIKASSVNHGGKTQSLTAPDARAQSQLLIKAYSQAGFDPKTVTYIETHGTGTELGDPIEVEGLKQAFKKLLPEQTGEAFCALGSVKTNMGHLEPASGIAGMVKVLLAMEHGKIPGNLHFNELNSYIDLDNSPFYLATQTKPWVRLKDANEKDIPRRAGVSSFGFGGTNAHIVLEEVIAKPVQQSGAELHKPHYMITFSAKSANSLQQKMADLYEWLKHHFSHTNLEDLSYTLNTGRTHFDVRCGIVANSLDELLQSLQSLIDGTPLKNCLINKDADLDYTGPAIDEVYHSALAVVTKFAIEPPQIYREKLLLLADLYTKHYPIEWAALHQDENHKRIASLPTYPFNKQRYWFDAELTPVSELNAATLPALKSVVSMKTKVDSSQFTEDYLKQIFAVKLKIAADQIASNETYEVYGVDSVLGLEITNRLENDFGTLPKTLLYERNTIGDLSAYLQQKYKDKVQRLLSAATGESGIELQETSASPSVQVTAVTTQSSESFNLDHTMQAGDIAIVGVSGIYPLAKNIDEFWDNLVQGKDCVGEVPADRWNYKDYPVKVGDEIKYFKDGGFLPDVDKFDPLFFSIAPRDAALMDPQERLFMQTCWATLEDAGYTRDRLSQQADNQVGVFAGVTYNFYPLFIFEEWEKGNRIPLDVQSFSIANRISYFLNLKGPSFVVDTACSSSLAAIHLACESLQRNECKMAIAGGVNLSLHPAKYHMLGSYSFMSDQGRCASFAEGGAGYVPSEGVGAVLLKPLAAAIADKDRIYGVIKSSSMNHGGKTSGYTVPSPVAQAELIKQALKRANINPRTLSYIEAHGTGTSLGDPIEIRGLQEAFEDYTQDKQFCAIGSVKSNIGHLESAAGISQLTKVLLQMQHKKLVPSLHAEKLNPFIDFENSPFFVQRELSDWAVPGDAVRRAGVSSFGAGGTNVHLIVEEYRKTNVAKEEKLSGPFIFTLSATNTERLQEYVNDSVSFLTAQKTTSSRLQDLRNICYTSATGREAMTSRLAIVTNSFDDLIAKLKSFGVSPEQSINQVWFKASASNTKLAEDKLSALVQAQNWDEIAKLWVLGNKIHWESLYQGQSPERVSLTSYPFAKRRCWVPTAAQEVRDERVIESPKAIEVPVIQNVKSQPVVTVPVATTTEVESIDFANDWFYTTNWQSKEQEAVSVIKNPNDRWLIFSDKELGFLLQHELGVNACLYCFAGDEFDELNSNAYYVNPARAGDYNQMFARVFAEQGANLKGVIYLWPFADEALETEQSIKLLSTFQALLQQHWKTQLQFCLVTRGAQSVTEKDEIAVSQRQLWSMTRVFGAEHNDYQVQMLDLDTKKNLRQDAKAIADVLAHFRHEESQIAMRDNLRHVNRLSRVVPPQTQPAAWRAPETALITGGLGALGSEVAKFLATKGTKRILLTGRSVLPEMEQWKNLQDETLLQKTANLIAIQKSGIDVRYVAVDVTDKEKMRAVISEVEKDWKQPVTGVFHLAGVTAGNQPIAKMTRDMLKSVLDTKIRGALHLHELFQAPTLQAFVMFSSLAAIPFFGIAGMVADATGNEFLDGLAAERHRLKLPALTINWSAWSEIGMSHQFNHHTFLDAVGLQAIKTKLGIQIMEYLLATNLHQVAVMKVNWQKFFKVNVEARKLLFFADFIDQHTMDAPRQEALPTMSRDQIASLLLNSAAHLLDLDVTEIELDVPFQNYGMDSIIGINFIADINEHFPDVLSPMDLYRYPSLNQLIQFLREKTAPALEKTEAPATKLAMVEIEDESQFLSNIAHLDDEQVRKMLEDELTAIDKWHR